MGFLDICKLYFKKFIYNLRWIIFSILVINWLAFLFQNHRLYYNWFPSHLPSPKAVLLWSWCSFSLSFFSRYQNIWMSFQYSVKNSDAVIVFLQMSRERKRKVSDFPSEGRIYIWSHNYWNVFTNEQTRHCIQTNPGRALSQEDL